MRKLLPKPPKPTPMPTPECASQQKRIRGSKDPVRTGSAGQKECLSVSHRAFAPRGCNAQHTQQQSYELMAQAAGKAEQGAELGCVYRKLKLGHNGDAVHQGSRGNGYFQLVELGARKARPSLASDAFAIHYNRRCHTRLESGVGALRPKASGFPAPIPAKAGTMPAHDGLGPDDRDDLEDQRKPTIELNQK